MGCSSSLTRVPSPHYKPSAEGQLGKMELEHDLHWMRLMVDDTRLSPPKDILVYSRSLCPICVLMVHMGMNPVGFLLFFSHVTVHLPLASSFFRKNNSSM